MKRPTKPMGAKARGMRTPMSSKGWKPPKPTKRPTKKPGAERKKR